MMSTSKPKLKSNLVGVRNAAYLLPNTHPLSNNIPDWLKLTAEGRLEDAYKLSQSTNNTCRKFVEGFVRKTGTCEGNCVIEQSGHGTVTIGSIEKYITDTAWEGIGETGCCKRT